MEAEQNSASALACPDWRRGKREFLGGYDGRNARGGRRERRKQRDGNQEKEGQKEKVKRSIISVHLVRARNLSISRATPSRPRTWFWVAPPGCSNKTWQACEEACGCWYLAQPHYTAHVVRARECSLDKLKRLLAYRLTPYPAPCNSNQHTFTRTHQQHITAATHYILGLLITCSASRL
jgi:hypothetical protein